MLGGGYLKVNQNLPISTDAIQKDMKVQVPGNLRFQELVKMQNEKIQSGNIQALLVEIEKAGDRLAKSRNFRDLTKYKNLIQSFIKETVDFGLGLKKSNTWGNRGQNRVLQIIEKIDKKLVELADELLDKEADQIQLLNIIGEIKGLIINLYT